MFNVCQYYFYVIYGVHSIVSKSFTNWAGRNFQSPQSVNEINTWSLLFINLY